MDNFSYSKVAINNKKVLRSASISLNNVQCYAVKRSLTHTRETQIRFNENRPQAKLASEYESTQWRCSPYKIPISFWNVVVVVLFPFILVSFLILKQTRRILVLKPVLYFSHVAVCMLTLSHSCPDKTWLFHCLWCSFCPLESEWAKRS